MNRRSPLISLVLAASLSAFAYSADNSGAFAVSIENFRRLSPPEQKKLLIAAMEHRVQRAANIYYEVEIRVGNYEFANGTIGRKVWGANPLIFRHWRLADSYRMDNDRPAPSDPKPVEFIMSGFNAKEGVGKSRVQYGKDRQRDKRVFGRIDTIHDRITQDNRYAYWLDGKEGQTGVYLMRELLTHKGSLTLALADNEQHVRVQVPWAPLPGPGQGMREYLLDPSKGFLPTRGNSRVDWVRGQGEALWRSEDFVVTASQLAGDVWMPTAIREIIGGSRIGNVVNVWDSKVTKLVVGEVTPSDLEIPFPPGVEVVDAIKGISYVVGENGEPTRTERLVGVGSDELSNQKQAPRARLLPIGIAIGVLCLTAFIFARRSARRRKYGHG